MRLPSGRLMPQPAHSRLEIVCMESLSGANSRVLWRSLSASINGLPPVVWGAGRVMGLSSCAVTSPAGISNNAKKDLYT